MLFRRDTNALLLRLLVSIALLCALPLLMRFGMPDYAQDYAAAWGWWHGYDSNGSTADMLRVCCGALAQLYPHMQTAHPPLATVLALPFALVPWTLARLAWCLLSWAAITSAWQLGRVSPAMCAVTASFWIIALVLGTHEPLLFLLLVLVLRLHERSPVWAGVLLGLCAALKIYPALIIVGVWFMGRQRLALVALGSAALAMLAAELILGLGTTARWLAYVPLNTAHYVDEASNISLVRLVRTIVPFASPLLATLLVSGLLLLPLLLRLRRGMNIQALVAVMLLASPLSWRHYAGLVVVQPLQWIEQLCLACAGVVALLVGLDLLPADNLAPIVSGPLLLALLLVWYRAVRTRVPRVQEQTAPEARERAGKPASQK